MAGLADQGKALVGAPSSVRIGTVDSLNPLVVSVQGSPYQTVGILRSYVPQVGDAVALLGQSPTSGSDPTTWLALGGLSANGQQLFLAEQTNSQNLPLTSTVLAGTEISFTTTSTTTVVQAWYSADLESVGATLSAATVVPVLDGVAVSVQALIVYEMPVAAATGRFTLGQQTLFTVGPGTHEIHLEGITTSGVANQIRASAATTSLMITVHG